MNTLDPGLADFVTSLIERRGGVVEQRNDLLVSLLPEPLSEALELPEDATIGGEDLPLLYGSPLLDRIIRLATEEVPIVYGHVDVPYLKRDGFNQVIAREIRFDGALVEVKARAETRGTYIILVCHYLALSDERKEGLFQIAVHEGTGAVIPGLAEACPMTDLKTYTHEAVPPQFSAEPERAVQRALRRATAGAGAELEGFLAGMKRRLHRDVKNTREYYQALADEMGAALANPNLTESQRAERSRKRAALPVEMEAKVEDLKQKYSVRVSVTGRAALRLLVPVVQLMVLVRVGKQTRTLGLTWNPLTKSLDPPACERCGTGTLVVYPVSGKSEMKMVCRSCAK